MSGTYKTTGGESWSDIARVTTGSDLDATRIKRANPSLSTPMFPGDTVQVPMDTLGDEAIGSGDLEIRVDGQALGTVSNIEISMAIDACARGAFTIPNTPETRDMFFPISFPRVTVDSNGERIFTGRASTPALDNSPDSKTQEVSIWADSAILETCPPPITSFSLEWINATLETIAVDLAALFGISVDYQAPARARFKRVDIQQDSMVMGFLQGLATQRGLILGSDNMGQLVIGDGTGGELVSYLEKGKFPTVDLSMQINDDAYYSDVTVTMPAKGKRGKGGKKLTVQNLIKVPGITRPFNFAAQDIDEGELEGAVNSIAGRAFSELITGGSTVATWTADSGTTYRPGQFIKAKSEEDRIPEPFEFLLSTVTLRKDAALTTNMGFVLPGVYSGEIPEVMPWQR